MCVIVVALKRGLKLYLARGLKLREDMLGEVDEIPLYIE
jgi:hypothetical protein